ncbi:MbtH family protein, partial [Enterobacter asburiae]
VCEAQSQEACQQWLAGNWRTLEPSHFADGSA